MTERDEHEEIDQLKAQLAEEGEDRTNPHVSERGDDEQTNSR